MLIIRCYKLRIYKPATDVIKKEIRLYPLQEIACTPVRTSLRPKLRGGDKTQVLHNGQSEIRYPRFQLFRKIPC